jgi:hypothetical protein
MLIVLGYVRYSGGKNSIQAQDLEKVEEFMGLYCEAG